MFHDSDNNIISIESFDLPASEVEQFQIKIACTAGKILRAQANSHYQIEARLAGTTSFTNLVTSSINFDDVIAAQPTQTAENAYYEALFENEVYRLTFDLKITCLSASAQIENVILEVVDE